MLLTPLLENVAHCVSHMVLTDSAVQIGAEKECASSFAVEVSTEARPHLRGRKPHVDYVISGIVEGEAMYIIPVEGKKKYSTCPRSRIICRQ